MLNDFKAELDQLRRILWFYIEQATGNARSRGADSDQHDKRLQRVNELLRALAPQGDRRSCHGAEPAVDFVF